MKKGAVILVQPRNGLNETTYAPLGLISLAAYVRPEFEVRIIDLRFDSADLLHREIERLRPLAVGFSMLTGSCITEIITAAKAIKEKFPEVKIAAGGIHPTFFPGETLVSPQLDFVIVNEGEKPLLNLLRALRDGSDLSGIANLGWKDEVGRPRLNAPTEEFLDLNNLPLPAWDLIGVERYVKRLSGAAGERTIDLYTSKGCPFPCGFCYNLNFNRRRWRAKSAPAAVAELALLHERYGINYFIIHDDNFVVDKKRALEIARLVRERGMKIKFSIDARIDAFDRDFLQKLKEAGLAEIRVGCESGSNRVLKDVIGKGITKEQTVKAVTMARDLDLKLILSFVIGWPTETIAERQETIDLVLKLQEIHSGAAIYPLWVYIPYPGTTLFNRAVNLGFKQPESLEAWGNYFWGKARLPWLAKPREYELIHELSPIAWHNKKSANFWKNIFLKIFRPPVLFRFRRNFWRWPLEARLIVGLKKYRKLSGAS